MLRKDDPYDKESDNYTLMNHVSNPSIKDKNEIDDRELSPNSLIQLGKKHTPKLLIWVSLYNEPYRQLLETIAGIYRSYYELVHWDKEYLNRVHVVIVADGYDRLEREFLLHLEKAGIFNAFETTDYLTTEFNSDKQRVLTKFKGKFNMITIV